MLAKEWVGMPFLTENLSFSTGIAIANYFAKASVNNTIDNMQHPLFLGIANANAIIQCEQTLTN